MRTLLTSAAIVILGVVAFFVVVLVASESGEVVTLHTQYEDVDKATRLWVVDHAGAEWVRTGHAGKGWFRQVTANPSVEFERAGTRSPRTAVPVRDADTAQAVNERFASKYGAADWIVALSGDAADRIPVRIDPR